MPLFPRPSRSPRDRPSDEPARHDGGSSPSGGPLWSSSDVEARSELAFVVPDGMAPPRRRRDRHGRGLRGPLLPQSVPAHATRSERFDDFVLDAVERIERRWEKELGGTEFAVEEVPPSDPAPWEDGSVPLGRCHPAESGQAARIVVYRRPVETRAHSDADLEDLVREVVVEHVAQLLARTPEEIDPAFRGHDD